MAIQSYKLDMTWIMYGRRRPVDCISSGWRTLPPPSCPPRHSSSWLPLPDKKLNYRRDNARRRWWRRSRSFKITDVSIKRKPVCDN